MIERSMNDNFAQAMKMDKISRHDWRRISRSALMKAPFLQSCCSFQPFAGAFAIRAGDLADSLAADFDLRFMLWFSLPQGRMSEQELRAELNDEDVQTIASEFLSEFTARIIDTTDIEHLNEHV